MKVAYIQTSPVFGKVRANVEAAVKLMDSVEADLYVLPELYSTGYQFKSSKEAFRLAEPSTGGYSSGRLIDIARKKKVHIVAGYAERTAKRVYNSSFIAGPGGLIGRYRKAHLFANEKNIFSAGNTALDVFDIGSARVGLMICFMICFDWIMPEVARTLALRGADIICHPSNLVLQYCPPAMITRSFENRVFIVTANRVGSEERVKGTHLTFVGLSQVVSPSGELLVRAGSDREETGVVEIDPREARDKHATPNNDIFKDRRTNLYDL
jgi:predicted amidohydrolase